MASAALPADSLPTNTQSDVSDALRIAAAFERELFHIEDSRLSGTDSQAAILIAAAIAVATFTGGLVKSGQVSLPALAATGFLAILVTAVALHARRERPRPLGAAAQTMKETGVSAADAVGVMYRLVTEGALTDSTIIGRAEYDAWYALSSSIKARRRVKSGWYLTAVLFLLAEVGAAVYTALSINPST
jgi:hypothetical protein